MKEIDILLSRYPFFGHHNVDYIPVAEIMRNIRTACLKYLGTGKKSYPYIMSEVLLNKDPNRESIVTGRHYIKTGRPSTNIYYRFKPDVPHEEIIAWHDKVLKRHCTRFVTNFKSQWKFRLEDHATLRVVDTRIDVFDLEGNKLFQVPKDTQKYFIEHRAEKYLSKSPYFPKSVFKIDGVEWDGKGVWDFNNACPMVSFVNRKTNKRWIKRCSSFTESTALRGMLIRLNSIKSIVDLWDFQLEDITAEENN